MTRRMMNTLNIRIELRASKLEKDVLGSCSSKANGSISTKNFTITIQRDNSYAEQLSTLAHEMVHVSQVAYGTLQNRVWKSDGKMHSRWNGVELGVKSDIKYRDRPWEKEAFGLQSDLASAYLNISKGKIELGKGYLARFHRELEGYKLAREEFKNPTNQFKDFNWKALSRKGANEQNNPPKKKSPSMRP